jgi:hypothetical protein
VKKSTWKTFRQALAVAGLVLLLVGTTFELANTVLAQTTGYRFGPNGIIFQGQNGGVCFESFFNAGPDTCINRIQGGNLGVTSGGVNAGSATISNAPVVALSTTTGTGSIPAGTSYRLAVTYMTITGGETAITAAQEATQTTTTANSIITVTAPLAAAGAAGYRVYSTNASGVGLGNATLTELLQNITTTVCAGAFQVNGPAGPGTGPFVCPFGVNAVLSSLVTTAPTIFTPNIPGSAPVFQGSGIGIPAANTAVFPAAIPELICNFIAQPALATITTIQTLATCPLTAGIQNSSGKVLRVTGHILFSTAGTPLVTISVLEGGITPIAVATPATTGSPTNGQLIPDYYLTTALTGATGTIESHGTLSAQVNTALGTDLPVYADQNTAASAAVNLTGQNNLTIAITCSTTCSAATLRDGQVWLLN